MLYNQRVEEISPNIRYCAYNIGEQGLRWHWWVAWWQRMSESLENVFNFLPFPLHPPLTWRLVDEKGRTVEVSPAQHCRRHFLCFRSHHAIFLTLTSFVQRLGVTATCLWREELFQVRVEPRGSQEYRLDP